MKPYYSDKFVTIYHGDCLKIMPTIPRANIDMILCDLPYGTTSCSWDIVIPFEPLWEHYKRLIKDNGAIVLTASQPFTSVLVMSNPRLFKYELIWKKEKPSNFAFAKYGVMKYHENICVFYKNPPTYNPQMIVGKPNHPVGRGLRRKDNESGANTTMVLNKTDGLKHPKSVLGFSRESKPVHPTQKPVALFEYLIKTYTNKGDLVLDNCAGSGTTGVACKNIGRRAILIEIEEKYCEIAAHRCSSHEVKMEVKDTDKIFCCNYCNGTKDIKRVRIYCTDHSISMMERVMGDGGDGCHYIFRNVCSKCREKRGWEAIGEAR